MNHWFKSIKRQEIANLTVGNYYISVKVQPIRLLKIKYSNKNELEIDFNIPHKPKIIFNKKPCKIYPSLSGKMLKYQLFSFFKKRNYRLHEFKYLKGLFKLLQQL